MALTRLITHVCVCMSVCLTRGLGWGWRDVVKKKAFVFDLFECRLFLYLAVVIVFCLLVAIVKPLGLISK